MRDLAIIIASGSSVDVSVGRDDAQVLQIVDAVGAIGVLLDGGAGAVITREEGEVVTADKPFRKIRLTSATDQTVTVSVGGPNEWAQPNKVVIINGGGSGAVPVIIDPPTAEQTTDDSSVAALSASAAISCNVASTRVIMDMTVYLSAAAPGPVRVRPDGTATATRGVEIQPGGSVSFKLSTITIVGFWAFSVYNPNGVAVDVYSKTQSR